jgi:hypothetical protein
VQHGRKVAMGFREIGLDRNGLAERGDRLVEAALPLQDGAEIGKQAGVRAVSQYSPVEHFGRSVVPARLMAEQTEQMQSAQVSGLVRQHFAITCFSFDEATGPMMGETAIERLRRIGIVCEAGAPCIGPTLKTVHHARPLTLVGARSPMGNDHCEKAIKARPSSCSLAKYNEDSKAKLARGRNRRLPAGEMVAAALTI